MACNSFAFIVLSLVMVHAADADPENCLCVKDDASVWKFLESLSVDVPDEEKDNNAVLPGELSPLAGCGCETDRRKRKVLESDDAPVDLSMNSPPKVDSPPESDSPTDDEADDQISIKIVEFIERSACPWGQKKFGSLCIPANSTDYD